MFLRMKLYHTLVNTNQMRHYHIYVKENPFMQKPMGITCPKEYVTVTLYMYGTIVCAVTLSPTYQKLEDCPQIVLISPHD